MTKKFTRIFSLLLAMLMMASMPMTTLAATYKPYNNKTTVNISKSKNATYYFEANANGLVSWLGNVKVDKGGILKRASVQLTVNNPGSSTGVGKVRYMRITLVTSDGKTKTLQRKLELVGDRTKITDTENGNAKVTYKSGHYSFWNNQTIKVSGGIGKSIKSIYVSANFSGGSQPNTYIYFKG